MRDVLESYGALNALMNKFSFGLRVSYDLGKTLKSCKQEAELYDELISKLNATYTTRDSQGNQIIPPEKLESYKTEIKELRDKEVEVWGKAPMTLTTLESHILKAHYQLKPEDKDFVPMIEPAILAPLDWLIVMDEEEAPEVKVAEATA